MARREGAPFVTPLLERGTLSDPPAWGGALCLPRNTQHGPVLPRVDRFTERGEGVGGGV